MITRISRWLGLTNNNHVSHHHSHAHNGHAGHTHGVIDPTIASTDRGLWAIKWSFVILAITAVIQLGIVAISGSVALFADTVHNIGDALTAVPLRIAFMLARLPPTKTFTYGYGRVEDLAGVAIVLIILISAIVAGYESIDRLIHPRTIAYFSWVAAAGVIGFLGNEAVAILRIKVGRQIHSAALIADGYHARTDGLTSLAVVVGAIGVALGYPLADPIVGLTITGVIFGIVWQSSKAVFTRMLDGIDPNIVSEVYHAAEHVPGIERIVDVKARWLGHRLHTDVAIEVNHDISLSEAKVLSEKLKHELLQHIPALAVANVRFGR
jgi:cation diffusion facilitator family transporter